MKRFLQIAALCVTAAVASPAAAKDWSHVTIATEGAFAPWNFTEADGTLTGYEVDLYKVLCERMHVECTLIAQNWDGMIPGLLAGKYDAIMAGMSATEKREKVIAFSQPYGSTGQGFGVLKDGPLADMPMKGEMINLVTNPDGAKKTIDELRPLLKGKVIGVQSSAIAGRFMKENFGDEVTIREYKSTEQHDLDLLAGRLDAIVASPAYLMTASKQQGNEGMTMAGPRFQGGVLGRGSSVGLRKEDTKLREMFNKALDEVKADGTAKKLAEKWFGFDVTVY
ncbi:amino acid ABC transporter substrate-binding protein (PAAT family) [Breoghania corrubedonensis]|uniref:Amino acid ABC transporter substrate-binding protein (PAAT family) n=1 Tax=Breoghania corrubedonensis TaxID=665038 RepID=A0A2T5V8X2_9HYPH|nr:transporter substrate-binding domain-containing protein [Breoghania corrubedonensis]PTW60206.1 amino acid ABC transporter substrate-binding protein (PAAT family) [Breoghania corrubedonensis]